MNLTPKQKAFADEYIKNGGNAYRAALKAGYAEKTAKDAKTKIMGEKSGVSEYIAEKQAEIDKKNGTDTMSLADIQAFRARVIKGE